MSSHPGNLHRQCPTFKPAHPTEEAARRAAITASRRNGIELSYYRCPECGRYHLTRSLENNPIVGALKRRS